MNKMNPIIDNLKTGDILLYSAQLSWNPMSWFGKLIEYVTKKPYSHVGIVLKDPTWIKPDMKGLYLWESSYSINESVNVSIIESIN